MFAFAIYDFRDASLWLVRDRFGIKPIYFAHIGDRFVFASQPSTIFCDPSIPKEPNWQTVSHCLSTTRITLGSNSLYRGIRLLQPAEELIWRGNERSMAIERYWDYPIAAAVANEGDYEEAVTAFENQLETSVQQRLVSDVPVGLFLSGGVDSNTIASMVHGLGANCRDAVSAVVGLGNPSSTDELAYARLCAKQFGYRLHPVELRPADYLETWLDLISGFRLPLSTPSDVAIYRLAKTAKEMFGVVLTGEGADELLCGYEVASWSGYDYDATANPELSSSSMMKSIGRQYGRCSFRNEADHYFALNSLIPKSAKQVVLSEAIWAALDDDEPMLSHYQSVFEEASGRPTVEKLSTLLHRINLEALLARLDRTTMHAGLEARVPFADHTLVESAFRFPFDYRIAAKRGYDVSQESSGELAATEKLVSKRILRDVAKRRLPTKLATRKKASFPTDVQNWLQKDWSLLCASYLSQSPFAEFLLSPSFRSELIRTPQLAGMWLWPIMNLAMWGDLEFFDHPPTLLRQAQHQLKV